MVAGPAPHEEGEHTVTDPFRAKPKPSAPQAAPEPPSPPPVVPSEGVANPSRGDLEDMRKAELQALARERNLSDDGTKVELVDRLSGSS